MDHMGPWEGIRLEAHASNQCLQNYGEYQAAHPRHNLAITTLPCITQACSSNRASFLDTRKEWQRKDGPKRIEHIEDGHWDRGT